MPFNAAFDPNRPIYSGGACPKCVSRGVLLILRRRDDGVLLFHCPTCGLSFTHAAPEEEPEYARSLDALAPGGGAPASLDQIRKAGLGKYAILWAGGPHGAGQAAPVLRPGPREVKTYKKAGFLITAGGVLIILKLLFHIIRAISR